MQRTRLFADPKDKLLHQIVLDSCRAHPNSTAIIDISTSPPRQISYAEYGEAVERLARNLVAAGLRPGEIVAVFLPNSWEFAASYHAITLAGGIPSPINPSYRERELHYQLEHAGAVMLITDGALLLDIKLEGLPDLRRVFTTRVHSPGTEMFSTLLVSISHALPTPDLDTRLALAALPFSSGTTGLPKGVMLTHSNLVTNVFQTVTPGELGCIAAGEVVLCFLPLYHIYGLTVALNCILTVGGTLVLMPRFDLEATLRSIVQFGVTMIPCVPPVLNAFCMAVEKGVWPKENRLRWVKSGAAPLATELAHRFDDLTGVPIRQGYGMTEASPVTHIGCLEPERYRPESIGIPVAQTDCRIVNEQGEDVAGEIGELVMRGPQFMLGYWKSPEATEAVMRDGWYWSGDIARREDDGFYFIVDRRKEMIKYKGFPIAPAEVEAVLLEHPAVRDCGVVAKADDDAGEVPCAFVVLRDGGPGSEALKSDLCGHVADRLTHYKQPREVVFVANIPRNPSGKILRRELRKLL